MSAVSFFLSDLRQKWAALLLKNDDEYSKGLSLVTRRYPYTVTLPRKLLELFPNLKHKLFMCSTRKKVLSWVLQISLVQNPPKNRKSDGGQRWFTAQDAPPLRETPLMPNTWSREWFSELLSRYPDFITQQSAKAEFLRRIRNAGYVGFKATFFPTGEVSLRSFFVDLFRLINDQSIVLKKGKLASFRLTLPSDTEQEWYIILGSVRKRRRDTSSNFNRIHLYREGTLRKRTRYSFSRKSSFYTERELNHLLTNGWFISSIKIGDISLGKGYFSYCSPSKLEMSIRNKDDFIEVEVLLKSFLSNRTYTKTAQHYNAILDSLLYLLKDIIYRSEPSSYTFHQDQISRLLSSFVQKQFLRKKSTTELRLLINQYFPTQKIVGVLDLGVLTRHIIPCD
jgi:hypothetical protein